MIYGLCFNGSEIPDDIRCHFTQRVRRLMCGHAVTDGFRQDGQMRVGRNCQCTRCKTDTKVVWFELRGVATNKHDLDLAVLTADNGKRRIHLAQRGAYYGIYTY